MGILVLFLIFKGMLSVFFLLKCFQFLLSMILAVGLSCMAFIMLRYVPFVPTFWRMVFFFFFFNHKWMLDFIKSFFCICWDDNMISSVCYCVFMDIEKPSLISEVNPI